MSGEERRWQSGGGRGSDGLLHFETFHSSNAASLAATPLFILHGLFGAGQNWRSVARALTASPAALPSVVLVDLPDHGRSKHYARPLEYPDVAADIEALVRALSPQADIMGHSMGGKVAMWFALHRPALVRRLIVVDIAPTDYDPEAPGADDRPHSEHPLRMAHLMRDIDPAGLSRHAVSERLAEKVPNVGLRQFLLTNLVEDPDHPGQLRWRVNLSNLINSYSNIKGFPDLLAQDPSLRPFEAPVLFVRGERSNYITPDHFPRMRALFPNYELIAIPEANHWPHFGPTAPRFVKDISEWLLKTA